MAQTALNDSQINGTSVTYTTFGGGRNNVRGDIVNISPPLFQ